MLVSEIDPLVGTMFTSFMVFLGVLVTVRYGSKNADKAANKVNAHLDNGLKTTLRRLDAKLTENGIILDTLVKTQDRPIIKTEPGGALVYANPAAMKMLGMTQSELSGDGWVRAIRPEDRDRVFMEWYKCVANKAEFGPVAYGYKHPSTGDLTMVEATAIPIIGEGGNILSWVATIVPVEQEKH